MTESLEKKELAESFVLYMSTYPPRECGIATFTKDLTTAIDLGFGFSMKAKILAINSNKVNTYNYAPEVLFQIDDSNIEEYLDVAKKINEIKEIKLINIQHEFGLFGGEYGSYLIAFLEIIKKPVIITFHSVLPKPDQHLKKVVQTLARKSECIIVMAELGREILRKVYGIKTPIEVISHGIPKIPFVPSRDEKKKKGFEDKIILSSFGMISSGKGYEYVINALPEVVKKYPQVLYLIIGETHPIVRRQEGESYRNFIENKVKKLKLEEHVKFYNKYVTLEEITQYLQATDIYICSNNDPNQITSGTLSYALGAGRAVISTPFLHAKELIRENRGRLVKFRNSSSFAAAILELLSNPELKQKMEEHAYANTRQMTWNNVALAYHELWKKYVHLSQEFKIKIPAVDLKHVLKLTDDFGIIQFANKTEPDKYSGYTLDDNARAMLLFCLHYSLFGSSSNLALISKYLRFAEYVQDEKGNMYNFVDHQKQVKVDQWSEDAQGRVLWALGYLMNTKNIPERLKEKAEVLFQKALDVKLINSSRAIAFTILGLYFYNEAKPSTKNVKQVCKLADSLISRYNHYATEDWQWFEESLTYSNSKLSESLFCAYLVTKREEYLETAISSLDFLRNVTFENGVFAPIGQNGWYIKNGQKAYFDQQPVDTASMFQTLLLAGKVTGREEYFQDALNVFYWFLGKNYLKQAIYDETTGGCYDGLGEFSINLNQGAESTISYQLARLILEKYLHR